MLCPSCAFYVQSRQLSECYWPILGDTSLAADVLADILSRLEAAYQAGGGQLASVQALLRVFKVGIRMYRTFVLEAMDSDQPLPESVHALGTVIQGGVDLLFHILGHAHEHRQYRLAKLVLQVLRICAENGQACGALITSWSSAATVDCMAAIIAQPIDEAAANEDDVVVMLKAKARAVLTWMHLCLSSSKRELTAEHGAHINDRWVTLCVCLFCAMTLVSIDV